MMCMSFSSIAALLLWPLFSPATGIRPQPLVEHQFRPFVSRPNALHGQMKTALALVTEKGETREPS